MVNKFTKNEAPGEDLTMTLTHIMLYLIDIVALVFLYGLLRSNNQLSKTRKLAFTMGIFITIFVIIAEVGTILTSINNYNLRFFNILFNTVGFLLTPIIPIVFVFIFDTRFVEKTLLIIIPTWINMLLVLFSPWYGLIFDVDANNNYLRGPLFIVFVLVYLFNILFLLVSTLRICLQSLYPIKWKIITLTTFTILATSIQLWIPEMYTSWHVVTLSIFLFYMLLSEFDGSFDRLTKVYNRLAFDKAVSQLHDTSTFSIIALDINDFKKINDTYGHDYGDVVLQEVARIIKESFDKGCSWYRIGGDEFCILCKHTNKQMIKHQLTRLIESLTKKRIDDRKLPTIAYGCSHYMGDKTLNFLEVLKEADQQMYHYKQLKKVNP